jgi:hypothetical protein
MYVAKLSRSFIDFTSHLLVITKIIILVILIVTSSGQVCGGGECHESAAPGPVRVAARAHRRQAGYEGGMVSL